VLRRIGSFASGAAIDSGFGWYRFCLIIALAVAYFVAVNFAKKRSVALEWATSLAGVLLIVLFGAKSNEFIYFIF
jgi:hypothetical protein